MLVDQSTVVRFSTLLGVSLMVFIIDESAAKAGPAIEIIPVAVYQGQVLTPLQASSVKQVQKEFGALPVVHAISPIYGMKSPQKVRHFKTMFANVIGSDDGIVMHVSAQNEWSRFASVSNQLARSLYGRVSQDCEELCGVDQTVESFSQMDFKKFLRVGRQEMEKMGLGEPISVIFEQGSVSQDSWRLAKEEGLEYDWSGFNLAATKSYLDRLPIFSNNFLTQATMPLVTSSEELFDGRLLDYARFGVYIDVSREDGLKQLASDATAYAIKHQRKVTVPIFFNVASLIHHQSKVEFVIQLLQQKAKERELPIVAWSGKGGSRWKLDALKDLRGLENLPMVLSETTQEQPSNHVAALPQKDPRDNDSMGIDATPPVSDYAPAEIGVIPPHSLEQSH